MKVPVVMKDDREVEAWLYEYYHPLQECRLIASGNYLDYREEKIQENAQNLSGH